MRTLFVTDPIHLLKNLRLSLLAVLLPLAVVGCASPSTVKVKSGEPADGRFEDYARVYRGTVTECVRTAQYTLFEELQFTAPRPRNGYALKVTVKVSKTLKGEEQDVLNLFIVDPETKHATVPVPGKPNIVFGAQVYVAFSKARPAVFWIDDKKG